MRVRVSEREREGGREGGIRDAVQTRVSPSCCCSATWCKWASVHIISTAAVHITAVLHSTTSVPSRHYSTQKYCPSSTTKALHEKGLCYVCLISVKWAGVAVPTASLEHYNPSSTTQITSTTCILHYNYLCEVCGCARAAGRNDRDGDSARHRAHLQRNQTPRNYIQHALQGSLMLICLPACWLACGGDC